MQDNQDTYPDVIERIRKLMSDTFGNYFANYYEGDPIDISKSSLPCIIVEKMATRITQDATATDKIESEVSLRVVLDKSVDAGASDAQELTDRKLRRIVEGRDNSSDMYLQNSVMGALRSNMTIGNALLEMNTDIDYFVQDRNEEVRTIEAVVSILTTERVIVGSRG